MTGLSALWMPMLLSAILVFVASSVIHMASPWHKSDYPKMPNEDKVRDALRPLAIPAGDYFIPRPADRADMRSPAFAEKMRTGPVVVMTVVPNGPMSMGRNLILWFVYCLVVSVFAAYITGRALPPGAGARAVARFSGATAFIGYAAALWQMWIWYHRSLVTTIKTTVDGLIYSILTACAFVWLWPR